MTPRERVRRALNHEVAYAGLLGALHGATDFALVSGAMICIDYIRWILRGLEEAIADLHEEPRLAEYMLDANVDGGAQGRPFYSPEMFRRVFKPRIARDNGDTRGIKAEFGGRLSFHGGINNQGLFHDLAAAMEIDARIRELEGSGSSWAPQPHADQHGQPRL